MDIVAIATLVSSTITAIAAVMIAFITLQQTARPMVQVRIRGNTKFPSAT